MDRMYILGVIERIERERNEHGAKFKDNPHHANCLPRFDKTIEMLKLELGKIADRDFVQRGTDDESAPQSSAP